MNFESPGSQFPVAISSSENPSRVWKKLLVVLAAISLVAGLLALVLWLSVSARLFAITRIFPTALPAELAGVTLIADTFKGGTVFFTEEGTGLIAQQISGVVISATNSNGGTARIVQSDDGKNYSVYLDGSLVLQGKNPRLQIARSDDGKKVAFLELAATTSYPVSPIQAPNILVPDGSISVKVYEPSTRTSIDLGEGYSPFFIDNTHVGWFTSAGIAEADLTTGETRLLAKADYLGVPTLKLLSPDGKTIGVYSNEGEILLYHISNGTVSTNAPIAIVRSAHSVVLGNDAVYSLREQRFNSVIIRKGFDGSPEEKIASIPSLYGVKRLLIGNI